MLTACGPEPHKSNIFQVCYGLPSDHLSSPANFCRREISHFRGNFPLQEKPHGVSFSSAFPKNSQLHKLSAILARQLQAITQLMIAK